MNEVMIRRFLCVLVVVNCFSAHSGASEIFKADEYYYPLSVPEAWIGGTVPGSGDVAVWNRTVTGSGTWSLGGDLSWGGIRILDPGGAPIIDQGNTLTVGEFGIDLSSATQDLILNCGISLSAPQQWRVGSGRVLAIGNGIGGGPSALLTVVGPGRLTLGSGSSTVSSTASGGMVVDGAFVVIAGPQSMGQGMMVGGPVTLTNGGKIRMNGWNSTSSTSWGSFTNPIYVPAGTWGCIDVFGRGTFSSRVQVDGTLYLGVSYVRGDISGDWSSSTGYIYVTNASSGGDFRLNATANFGTAGIWLGQGVTLYRADNYGSGGTTTVIGEVTGVGTLSASSAAAAGRTNVFVVGGRNTNARFDGQIVNGTRIAAVRKVGTGAWVLSANHPYTGMTLIEAGKLVGVTGGAISNSSFVAISNNATLGVAVEAIGPQFSVRNVNVAAGSVASLEIDMGGSTANTQIAPLRVVETLTVNGTLVVKVVGGKWGLGVYPLIAYSNLVGSGTIVAGQLPNRVSGFLTNDTSAKVVSLVVTSYTGPLKWATGSGVWDLTTPNWVDASGASVTYQETGGYGDPVEFEDSYSVGNSLTITLATIVSNAAITVSGTKTFTLVGPGSIVGKSSINHTGTGILRIGTTNAFTGGIYLRGGVLEFSDIRNLGASSSPLYFDGGTLRYMPGTSADISAGRTITIAGAAIIDVGANEVTFTSPIGNNGLGSLTKRGVGRLTLAGANSYRGNTIVAEGTLALATGATIPYSPVIEINSGAQLDASARNGLALASGQTLRGNGVFVGNLTNTSGSILSPGISVGTLTVNGTLVVSGGSIEYEVDGGADRIQVNGDLVLSGGTLQLISSSLPDGTYRVIDYTGSLLSGVGSAGSIVVVGGPAGKVVKLDDSIPGQINLVVQTPIGTTLVWSGTGNVWDINTSQNWLANGLPTVYQDGASVVFDDRGASQPYVDIVTTVSPQWITVDSSSDYTFMTSTAGRISGAGGITKRNSGNLYIQVQNNNSGPLVIEGGTVWVNQGGRLGPGNITNNASLIFNTDEVQTIQGNITGTGSLYTYGQATIILAGTNTYTGGTHVYNGLLQVGNGGPSGTLGSGDLELHGALVFNLSGSYVYEGRITGGGSITNVGSGTVILSGENEYMGYTAVTNGTLRLGGPEALPVGSPVFISGGTLDIGGFDVTMASLEGTGGRIVNDTPGKTNVLTVGVNGNSTTYSGVIADNSGNGGAIELHKVGAGSLLLTGNNSYSGGTTVAEGTLALRANTAAGRSAILISNQATLMLDSPSGGSVYVANPIIVPSGATVFINSDWLGNELSGNFYGDSTSMVQILGAMSIGGASTKVFQNYQGTVEITTSGTLRFSSTSLTSNGGDQTTFKVDGYIQTRNGTGSGTGVALGALYGTGTFSGPQAGSGVSTWVVGAKGIDCEFSGMFGDGGSPSTANNLVKVGSAKLTLSGGVSTYGYVAVSNGTLSLVNQAAPTNAALISVASNAILDVSGLQLEGEAAGTLVLGGGNGRQTLAGSGTILGNVKISGTNPVSIAPGLAGTPIGTLTITGRVELSTNATLFLELARPAHDRLIAGQLLPSRATLVVTNTGDALQAGDQFQLFTSPVTGFGEIQLPSLPQPLFWTNMLAIDGTIRVLSAQTIPIYPTNISYRWDEDGIEISWPKTHTGWTLQMQTNSLAVGLSTNWVDVAGSANTNVVKIQLNGTNRTAFFRLIYRQ